MSASPHTLTPVGRSLRLLVLGIGAAVMLFPYVWMIATSFKPQAEVFSSGLSLIPEHSSILANYGKALGRIPMGRVLLNGVVVCLAIVVFQIAFALPAAYALAKLRFRGRDLMFGLVILGLLIPIHAVSIPMFAAFRALGLINTLAGLVVPFTLSVFAVFLFRQFIKAMPDDLIHAGRMDGLSEGAIVRRIVLPNAWPAATAFAIFSVVTHWNDLYWPSIVISKTELATPPLGVLFFRAAEAGDDYGALMAATVIVTAPLVVFFLFAQKAFIEGITMTGLKG
ncbi:carbohydrate ABC transporter permease [Siculibacillus lacustris]|uniref:sn-glycerol-3-phosphate transport system permease protein UgpE n=1 Tax=Siculibacillus lacustris TaxID=1549641 RepID=A0A4Q9VN03_9HYPH|nr:carbohydrate ABC transporter permease [Siculibacillus lacustris]TBW36989.1 carbohydrate ABC transporter permease [Siculibacillus lacustris]